jgi:hypothetical protein
VRFDRGAAPESVATIETIARGPIYDLSRLPNPEPARTTGYFEGLSFDYARPHLELRLPVRFPKDAFTVATELDARSLGLEGEFLTDRGKAMEVMQFELLPAMTRPNSERMRTPTLVEWARRFEQDHDPSFLVGKTRRELLEAVGYRFQSGLNSIEPTRGTVALVPSSPDRSTLSLSILLADYPTRKGRWMVVGRIVEGLEIAEAISESRHASPHSRDYRPAEPITVLSTELDSNCAALEGD